MSQRINEAGLRIIKFYESLHDGDLTLIGLQPKLCPANIWTEGYGRAMRDASGNFIKGIANKKLAYSRITIHTEAEAVAALKQDVKIFEATVKRNINVALTDNQFSALVSHAYNTGGSATLFKLINTRATNAAIRTWFETKYISANGKVLKGLIKRRKSEADLYFTTML